ncbi:MAG: N-acetylmuramoyl-L-alanine amidase [Pararhizobium sp.]|nr:N-acetylmuramoyl-L-alanine amidase [Pararhizobium sp.]MDO9415864.1 N-acetylmuramoyl-L-alanine amidase [Pararhizobium sp.]
MPAGLDDMKTVIRARFSRALGGGIAICLAAFAALALVSPAAAAEEAEIAPLLAYGARIAGNDARTRIVIDFDRKPEFSLHYVGSPVRVIVDLPQTSFGVKPDDMKATGLFTDIRYGAMGPSSSRLVLTAARPVSVTKAVVQADPAGKGFQLVLESAMATDEEFANLVRQQEWSGTTSSVSAKGNRLPEVPVASGDFVIAVDAGHGGIDTGAIGAATKTEEKHVTLDFAKDLVEALNQEKDTRAFLTRKGDEFLSLPQRVQIARQHGARLFISLHADTLRQKDIRGATVYTISDRASDSLAADLAKRENLSDEIAGVPLQDEPADVADILIDLTRRETQAFSTNLARSVVGAFDGQIKLINNPHRHAGFRVLQAPDVPSVLLELGFLSNKDDEKLLLDPAWRKKVSALLAEAVRHYRAPELANGG